MTCPVLPNTIAAHALAAVGLLVALRAVAAVAVGIYRKFLRGGKDLKKLGKWAIVTGATDGIGRAMANELARQGLSVVLMSRTQSKLDEAQKEMVAKYSSVQVQTLAVDFSTFAGGARDDPAIAAVRKLVDSLDGGVAVLVNNVGVSYEHPEYYDQIDDKRAGDLVELNINSTTWMTRIVLPGMVSAKKGAVVNIASGAGLAPSPLLTGYCAAKCYINMFTKSLAAEYAHIPGLSFQCQSPLFVTSKLSKIRRTSLTTPSPAGYAKAAVRAIGYEVECSPYWAHAAQLAVLLALPEGVSNSIQGRMHKDIRHRALKRAKKDS
eukprot:TRINITY_DN13155_c0_g1_i1.p2 TRINITY_DN13155_c0_g1~~TRINITY_DN13155_c0_g1_i1.p2  ORF type:complete len:350 (+),score=148.94 TRINITY_DN13155_c0_g1_i1:87-1052(+)